MRIFHLICVLICAYSIVILIGEKYEVAYSSVDKDEAFHYLGCFSLRDNLNSYANKTKVDLDQLNQDVYRFFEVIKARETKKHLAEVAERMFLSPIRSRKYFIHLDRFCLSTDHQMTHFNKLHDVNFFYFKKETFDFYRVTDFNDRLDQLVVEHRERPYSSCKRDFSKFKCLNDCFTSKNRLSKYYFDGSETGTIFFDHSKSESVKDDEDSCFSRCEEAENCKLTYFTPIINMKKNRTIFIQAYPLLSETDFWFQLVGLVSLILNIALLRLLRATSLLIQLVNQQIKKYFFVWQITNFLLVFACALYLTYSQMADYQDKLNNPVRKKTTIKFLEAEQFSLVVCIQLSGKNYGKTLLEFEKETDSLFADTVEDIHLVFQGKRTSIYWNLAPKVIFFFVFRCFRIELFPRVPRYQSVLSPSQVTVKFKHDAYALYLLAKEQEFVPWGEDGALLYKNDGNVVKRIIKRSRSNKNGSCTDYAEIFLNCSSKLSCVNKCLNRYFYEKHRNVSTGRFVIDKDFYSAAEWARSFVLAARPENDQIKRQCEEEFSRSEPDCLQVYFEHGVGNSKRLSYLDYNYRIRSIELFYDVVSSVEESPSFYKLVLDLLSIQSVFFGLTMLKLIKMLYGLVKARLGLRIRGRMVSSILIYLACSVGFLYQIVHIINEMNGELIKSQHFVTLNSMSVPELVFCFEIPAFEEKLNGRRKLTGAYLNEITSDLSTETVFQKVSYLNETNGWTELELSSAVLDFFFFTNQKCFTIKLEREYRRRQFYFQDKTEVLQVYFKRPTARSLNPVHFMSRTSGQFSKTNSLSYLHCTGTFYSVAHELFEINYQDKFHFIRNPLLLFYSNQLNNAEKYLAKLAENFERRSNSCTLNMPLEKKQFDLEIDDASFERYFQDVQNVTDHADPVDPNYHRTIAINYLYGSSRNIPGPHFVFSLIYFKKIVMLTNESGFAALLLNILNATSFWFDFHMLDIFLNLYKIKALFGKPPSRPSKLKMKPISIK